MAEPSMPALPPASSLTTNQLQRVYLLLTVRALWPTITPAQALTVAAWLEDGATDG